MKTPTTDPAQKSSTFRIVISWIIVGAPLIWGITQTVIKSLALFK